MIRYVARQPPDELLFDPPGVIRVSLGWIQFPRLLDAAFEQIRMYAKSDVAVSLRLLRGAGRHCRFDARSGVPEDSDRARMANGGRLRGEDSGEDEMRELRVRQESLAGLRPEALPGTSAVN